MTEKLLSVPELAGVLSLSKQAAYRLIAEHKIEHYKVSARRIGISPEQISDFLNRRRVGLAENEK